MWLSQGELAASLIEKWKTTLKKPNSLFGIGGFPYAGKTSIINNFISQLNNHNSYLFPVEAFIKSREERLRIQKDGCHPEAYNLLKIKTVAQKLLKGHGCLIPDYSWELGQTSNHTSFVQIDEPRIVFIDGTITITNQIAHDCDRVVVFQIEKKEEWLNLAIERDVATRYWDFETAYRQNLEKWDTSERLIKYYGNNITDKITVRMSPNANSSPFLYSLT